MTKPSAWTAAGWRSPTATSVDPRGRDARSCATAAAKRSVSPGAGEVAPSSCATPGSAAASARVNAANLARTATQAMIGRHPRRRRQTLDGVEPIRRVRRTRDAPPRRPLARVAQRHRSRRQQIGVERDDDVGLRQVVGGLEPAAEGELGAGKRMFERWKGRAERHLHVRVQGANARQEAVNGGRAGGLEQDAQAGAIVAARAAQALGELIPRRRCALVQHATRAIRIVEPEHMRLLPQPGGAEACRMVGVAFDLGRPAVIALGEKPDGESVE